MNDPALSDFPFSGHNLQAFNVWVANDLSIDDPADDDWAAEYLSVDNLACNDRAANGLNGNNLNIRVFVFTILRKSGLPAIGCAINYRWVGVVDEEHPVIYTEMSGGSMSPLERRKLTGLLLLDYELGFSSRHCGATSRRCYRVLVQDVVGVKS